MLLNSRNNMIGILFHIKVLLSRTKHHHRIIHTFIQPRLAEIIARQISNICCLTQIANPGFLSRTIMPLFNHMLQVKSICRCNLNSLQPRYTIRRQIIKVPEQPDTSFGIWTENPCKTILI